MPIVLDRRIWPDRWVGCLTRLCPHVLSYLSDGERCRHGIQPPFERPIDLDALDDYLMSDHAPDDSMGLSDLDGFLTGVIVGPS